MFTSLTDRLVDAVNLPAFTIPTFSLFQMLDIVIVATVIYLILKWVRRTQAWVLFRGIVFIAVIAILAEIFDLVTVQWIVSNTIAMGLVVVVILFQPELRKALEQLGRGQYLPLKHEGDQAAHSTTETIDAIIHATKSMSATLTGALIVIEQEIDLREHEARGTKLDAEVSTMLLLNIFEKNAPLHDGAVVIRNNRISSASSILPLTPEMVDASLGTRHRAALGITEVSDARVIVVSEETGTISIAIEGKIQRNVTENQIKELLMWGKPAKTGFSLFRRRKV